MRRFLIFLLLMTGLTLSGAKVSLDEITNKELGNISALAVLPEETGEGGKLAGISDDEIKAIVELQLRKQNIELRGMNEPSAENAYLYVNVNLLYVEKIDHFVYSISIELNRDVYLPNSKIPITAGTWNRALIGISSKDKIRRTIEEDLNGVLVVFSNDFLRANTRKVGRTQEK